MFEPRGALKAALALAVLVFVGWPNALAHPTIELNCDRTFSKWEAAFFEINPDSFKIASFSGEDAEVFMRVYNEMPPESAVVADFVVGYKSERADSAQQRFLAGFLRGCHIFGHAIPATYWLTPAIAVMRALVNRSNAQPMQYQQPLAPGPCGTHADFIEHLAAIYQEAPVAMGITSSGSMLEVLASESGPWTMIFTIPSGLTCGITAGDSWEFLPAAQSMSDTPT